MGICSRERPRITNDKTWKIRIGNETIGWKKEKESYFLRPGATGTTKEEEKAFINLRICNGFIDTRDHYLYTIKHLIVLIDKSKIVYNIWS